MPAGGLSCNIQGPGWGIYPKINLWSFHSLLWDSHFFWGGGIGCGIGVWKWFNAERQVFFRSGYCCSAGIGSLGLLPASFLQFNGWLKGKSTGNHIIIIYYIIFVATARIFFWKYRGSNMFFQRFWIDESCHSQHRTILSSLWNISLRK